MSALAKINEKPANEKRESIVLWWKERDEGGIAIIMWLFCGGKREVCWSITMAMMILSKRREIR